MKENIAHLLKELEARLPELEWRMRKLPLLSEKSLPRGLFSSCLTPTSSFYIKEVKNDIHALACQESIVAAQYLAKRIHEKINVLIAICNLQPQNPTTSSKTQSLTTLLHTRKNFLEHLEEEINNLEAQKEALEKQLEKLMRANNQEIVLRLQSELGSLNQRLTLALEQKKKHLVS